MMKKLRLLGLILLLGIIQGYSQETSDGLSDVWDFGATQLDDSQYNNQLTEEVINAWYAESITPGSSDNVLPDFTTGDLSWTGGGNDRLRTSNTDLTRYDENISDFEDFKGRIYVNSSGATGRYFSIDVNQYDEVTIWALSQESDSNIHFEYVDDPTLQNDAVALGGELTELKFTAEASGTYHIYDDTGKPSYFRIARKSAAVSSVSGNVDTTAASGIPSGYNIVFTNEEGATWSSSVSDGTYQIDVLTGFEYSISLEGADGYTISNGTILNVEEATVSYDINIEEVGSGEGTGLTDVWDFGASQLDGSQYNNELTVDVINSWYDESITPGSASSDNVLPDFTVGDLSWTGGGNDRLRTTNTDLTRYDENISDYDDFKGRIYVNSGGATDRYFSLNLQEDDVVTISALSQNGNGNIHFEYVADPTLQDGTAALGDEPAALQFTAVAAGIYHVYDDTDKPSYFRIERKSATYASLSGNLDVSDASGLTSGYSVVFTNDSGKTYTATISGDMYQVDLPIGFEYSISLEGADDYTISGAATLNVDESTSSYDIKIIEIDTSGLADVWDFGASQLDATQFNNRLTEENINSWYDESITTGSAGNILPDFSEGALSWTGGGNDRLRTVNTNLTRYDENISDYEDFKGRVYVNAGGATDRYMSLELREDDEVTVWGLTQNGGGNIHFENVANPELQDDVVAMGGELTELNFVAKVAGTYHIYDDTDKPSYFRIVRKSATYASLTGNVDLTDASGIPNDYSIVFTNELGKEWSSGVTDGSYQVDLPTGYQYSISLEGANGYIISNGTTLDVTESTTTYDITIEKVEIRTVTGSIVGLDEQIEDLTLTFIPDPEANSIYVPQSLLDKDAATYSVQLEPNIEYTIKAEGVNDYYIPESTLEITGDITNDIVFELKPLQDIAIVANGLNDTQKDELTLSFININEPSYSYTFSDIDAIALRDGVYELSVSGLDKYPLALAFTSNLKVEGETISKTLDFENVTNWSFDDADITADTEYYKGLAFTGNIKNEKAKGHLVGGSGGTIAVPLEPGQKMVVTYYYAADFSIDGGDAITTNSGSTSQLEYVTYNYPGTEAGTAVISTNATSYITDIEIIEIVPYSAEITVGVDKDYQTINDALYAISSMERPNDERVTVLIDPANYEEMVVINENNITLKNAASIPGIELTNEGVDIAPNAVRITSYYGYGYNYFSQGTDNKWHEDVLEVNKANGTQPYTNVSGTTNASYWNATLVVSANGFIAEDLIIENSYNQYISRKESEDIVVLANGNKGERPTDYGNTSVQDRSFVERAAAIGIANGSDKIILDKCRIVGRQDAFYGGSNARAAIYKGAMMGAVDYIFGAMTAVFYKSDFVLNTSDVSSDAAYITAAQQSEGRGFLMYECNIISTEPGVNTASTQRAKPGFFGRPWQANTSEVVFYNTNIDVSTYPGFEGMSLIDPEGWKNTLSGESEKMYEYGTIEASGVNHMDDRVSWSTVLEEPILNDGTEITTLNFTKGDDGWDPFPNLEANDDTDNDGILDVDDNCISTPNPDQSDMDNDGIGDVCDDSDGDGLVDSEDSCPNSTEGATVDVFGCEVFSLAADNFSISVHDVSCNGNGDGFISISAADTNYTYNVSVSGTGNGSATLSSSNGFSENVENLAAGTYDICITVDGQDGYEQCFNVTIGGPTPLDAYSSVNYTDNTVTFSLSGASLYNIDHNGKVSTTTKSQVKLNLEPGKNTFSIYTDSECQGTFNKEVLMSKEVMVFPNPTKGNVKLYINGDDTKIDISLTDPNGKEYISKKMDVPSDRVIDLDLTNYSDGVYFLILNSATVRESIKLIKS